MEMQKVQKPVKTSPDQNQPDQWEDPHHQLHILKRKFFRINYRLALFVATVATDSAVFVATLPVSQFRSLCYSIFTSSLRSVQDLVRFVAISNRLRQGLFYRITTMFG